jgi:hypothetical protein
MVTRQRLRVGTAYAGKIGTVHVEDTHFRVTCDGADISLHPRTEQRPVTRWESQDPGPESRTRPASSECVSYVVSRNCQASPETTPHEGTLTGPRTTQLEYLLLGSMPSPGGCDRGG